MTSTSSYSLWRQDDNGVIVRIKRYQDWYGAELARQQLESKGHKQHYWIEVDSDGKQK